MPGPLPRRRKIERRFGPQESEGHAARGAAMCLELRASILCGPGPGGLPASLQYLSQYRDWFARLVMQGCCSWLSYVIDIVASCWSQCLWQATSC